jgi:predicted enzyme related to lactoylglutathione lyase
MGINGGITRRGDMWSNVVNTIDVPSVDEYIEKIVANGGSILMPKTEIPNVGYLAYFKDTEGNTFGIMGPLS